MTKSALYYPYIDISDSAWLKSALLFWDKINTIVPDGMDDPYKTEDSRICHQEGILTPLRCSEYHSIIDELGAQVTGLLNSSVPAQMATYGASPDPNLKEVLQALRSDTRVAMHADKFGRYRLHPDKVSAELQSLFAEAKEKDDAGWIMVHRRFADLYMGALAVLLAERAGLSPITNNPLEHGSTLLSLLGNEPEGEISQPAALFTLTMKNIKIDGGTPIHKILEFRVKKSSLFAEFRAQIEELEEDIGTASDLSDLKQKTERVYKTKIERELKRLEDELRDAAIENIWAGFQRAVFLSLPAGSMLTAIGNATAQSLALGIGAFITISDIGIRTLLARRRIRRSPWIYLYDVKSKLSAPPSTADARNWIQEYQQSFQA